MFTASGDGCRWPRAPDRPDSSAPAAAGSRVSSRRGTAWRRRSSTPNSGAVAAHRSLPKFGGISSATFSSPLRRPAGRARSALAMLDVPVEVSGSGKLSSSSRLSSGLILVEGGEGEVFDVERDAVADRRASGSMGPSEREGEPDRIAQDFHRLPPRIGPEPAQIEAARGRAFGGAEPSADRCGRARPVSRPCGATPAASSR